MCKNESCAAESAFLEEAKKAKGIQLKLESLRLAKGLAGGSSSRPQSADELIESANELLKFINQ